VPAEPRTDRGAPRSLAVPVMVLALVMLLAGYAGGSDPGGGKEGKKGKEGKDGKDGDAAGRRRRTPLTSRMVRAPSPGHQHAQGEAVRATLNDYYGAYIDTWGDLFDIGQEGSEERPSVEALMNRTPAQAGATRSPPRRTTWSRSARSSRGWRETRELGAVKAPGELGRSVRA
jgi:hypothetical protein